MGQFSIDVANWVKKTKQDADETTRAIALGLLRKIVMRSPVGNPELWASNAIAASYNSEVSRYNSDLRADPANLTKNNRLRKGLKLNDGMDINAPAGYVGGRFRGNWQVSISEPAQERLPNIDPAGATTISVGAAVLVGFKAGPPIFITNNLPYGPRLEYEGWSKQAPAGMVGITVAEFSQIVNEAVSNLK